ncbi:MAG: IS5 family transposase [Planctomycetota bacterium]
MVRRHELTDSQWVLIASHLPGKAEDPGRTAEDNRLFVNAVLFVLKTGIPWSDLPARYGKPNSVWKRFDRWCNKGVWEQVFRELGEEELMAELEEAHLDSSTVKARQVASTGRRLDGEKKATPMSDDASGDREAD